MTAIRREFGPVIAAICRAARGDPGLAIAVSRLGLGDFERIIVLGVQMGMEWSILRIRRHLIFLLRS